MSPAGTTLRALIAAARRRLQRDTAIAILAAVLAVAPAVMLLSWLLAGVPVWSAPTWGPLILELAALVAAVALAVWGLRRWARGLGEPDVAATAEAKLGLPAGSVRGILELGRTVPQGTSAALFSREESRIARHFVGQRPRELSGPTGVRVRRRRLLAVAILGGLVIATGTLGFMSPERSMKGWVPLLQPVAYLIPPPLPALQVLPGDTEVTRGADVPVRVTAPGRPVVTVVWRVEGAVLQRATVEVTNGTALGVVPQVDAPTVYWVEAPDGARSDRYLISPVDPLLVSELIVEVRYPEYMGRAAERYDVEVPPLEVPRGTELVIRGRATRPLESADLVAAAGRRVRLNIQDNGFSGRWKPTTSGTYEWRMTDRHDVNLATAPAPIDIAIVDDAPPEVEITFPGVDTVLDAAMMQPIAADARDDNGLSGAWLVSWRVSATGERDAPVEQPVRAATLDHALLRTALDASERNLTGGDTLKYFIRVADDSPGRQTAVSTTYSLWLPGRAEMRDRAVAQARAAVERAEELAASAQQLAETTRAVQRSTRSSSRGGGGSQSRAGGGGSPGSNGQSQPLDFETTEQVRSALDQQQQMLGDLETQRQQLESMERAMEAAGLRDPQLQERLQELRDLYDQILTPELRQRLEELRQALNESDPAEIQKAVEELAKEQEALEEQLDRSLELLRKAAAEQEMNALAQEARELSTQQEALAESMKERPPTPEQAEMQEQLAERADSLRRNIEQLQQTLSEQGEMQASEQAGEASKQVGEASQSMGEAASDAKQQKGDRASQSGQEAAEQMNEAADKLEAARKSMAASWKKEVGDSVEQATSDALALAQRQQDLLQRMQQAMGQQSGQQGGQQQDGQKQGGQQGGQKQGGQKQGGQQGGQKQGGQKQGGQKQGGQQGGQKQGGQQQGGQQGGQQQGGQQQGGQQQGGQQQGGQQQGGQQQGGQQQGGQQQGGQKQGGQQQGGQQQGGQQQGDQQQNGDGAGQGGSQELQRIRAEQAALQQSLEQLGRNLSETGQRSPMLNRKVGAALGRANLSMQKTMESLSRAGSQGTMPTDEAAQTLDALNALALALLNNAQQIEQSQDGTGVQDALKELTELAKDQSSLSGRSRSLLPMNVAPQAMARQMGQLARDQRQIADRLGGMNSMRGAREDALGQLDELVREANRITRELEGSRLTPDIVARQERLFHKLLDAGRTLEREETTDERVAERPGAVEASQAAALDPVLFEDATRYRAPTPEELKSLPPAYRRLVLEYFERLNRAADAERAAEARER